MTAKTNVKRAPVPAVRPIVHVVDDDQAVRDSLCYLLCSVDLDARGYLSAEEFLAQWQPHLPGCLLLDLRMPGINGLELQERLVREGHCLPILFLSGHGDVPTAVRAMQSGAMEFLTKPFSERYLLERVQAAIEQDLKQRRQRRESEVLAARYAVLTPREREVLHAVIVGKTNAEIGQALAISHKTVELHRGNLMKKMHAGSVANLVAMCTAVPACQEVLGRGGA